MPFEELPRGVGGSTGKIVTANNPIVGSGWKYGPLSIDYAPEGRFVRIHEMLGGKKEGSIVPADYAEIHKDRITSTAESFLSLILDEQFTVEGVEKEALALLNEWRKQPVMDRDTAAPLLYVLLRTQILALLESLPGAPLTKLAKTVDPHLGGEDGMVKLLTVIGGKQWSALSNWAKSRTPEVLPPGYTWERLAKEAFKSAVKMAVDRFGSDVGKWRYGSVHKSAPKHAANAVLSEEQKQRFNAVPLEMGGDADTVQAAGGWEEVVLQSVARWANIGIERGDF